MSGSGRKHVSKWDSKEDTHHHHPSVDVTSGSHYRDKDPQPVLFNAGRNANASRRSSEDQHSGQARTRSRVSQNNDNSYYSEQDETRQQFSHRSDSRSYSRSRSRSRSPVYRSRRDHAGSYDRHKTRTRDEFNKPGSDYGWEDKAGREPRETRYHHSNDFREDASLMMMKGARSSDYDDDTEERSRREHLKHDGVSDPRLKRQRSELTGEGRFRKSCDIPCKFFAAGNCRNGHHCRFSHHGGADRKQPQDNKNSFYRQDSNYHSGHNRWNGDERLDNGKFSKGTCETKGSGWIGDMEMSPDWNYSAHNLKKRMKEAPGVGSIGQSSKSRVDDQRSSGMYSYGDNKPMLEKPIVADSHQNYNNVVNTAPPVQAYNQNHHDVLPYQNSPTPGGTQHQVIAPESVKAYQDNHHSVVEKAVPVQSGVTREQIDQISNISATIAQLLANRRPLPQLTQALQMPSSLAVQPNHATQSNNPLGMSADTDEAPLVTASQVSNVDEIQVLPVNTKASQTDAASKEEECKKAGEDVKEADNIVDEDDDDGSEEEEEEDKKEMKDTKGMRTFKFALVEIVKELLKPAWKEGKMKKDGYKNIVKKVVEKVTGSMQSGNVPQTQEKIDHYLSASKPKLTKLVQAYISKAKKT
ncbi:zinc finger CCCH domain-containing protein 38 [Brassica rapa]|uniref:C3H1-type domain-containing protein n=1 Tax=Brassica campestris TaxID=3711 RepID=M4F909_BRACM|nr:zinc finger CCCH domain-containing protein 38 [Brassica rapa]